jgi:2-polyprenyl-3-methyl-5-hydroxy-6-metoxy-1,4-benzoquinol methylase
MSFGINILQRKNHEIQVIHAARIAIIRNAMSEKRLKYDYHLGTDSAGERVVRIIGENKRVLELGPGPGTITKLLSKRSNCRVTALEIDAEAVKKLAPYCERVYQGDLNDPNWPDAVESKERFDAVTATDVLEHLYEPLTVLKAMKGLLNETGCIVVSLPHAGHSVIHACLLDEDFEYSDIGLLDRTHIRFFGIKNIQRLFENAGLKIVHAEFVVRKPEHTEFAKRWANTPSDIRSVLVRNPFGSVYQVVVKAVPEDAAGKAISLMDCQVSAQNTSFLDHVKAFLRVYVSAKMYSRLQGFYASGRKLFKKD